MLVEARVRGARPWSARRSALATSGGTGHEPQAPAGRAPASPASAPAAAVRILLAAGGTGGHVFPALAVARELERRWPAAQIEFVGTAHGPERRWVREAGYALRTLRVRGMQGRRLPAKLAALAGAWAATLRCWRWMRRERPSLVIGAGGYASAPAILAAKLLGVRTILLEQNHLPGATNRWLARYVDLVCVPSEQARARLRGRAVITGNPVREAFARIGEPEQAARPTVLVVGGSRGARSINQAVCDALAVIARWETPPRFVHQTGVEDLEQVRERYAAYPGAYEIAAFFDDLATRYAAAHLVVSRAGATTIAELAAAGRASLLVPYPHAADDHQRVNAAFLAQAGAALVVEDRELTGARLAREIGALLADRERLRAMGQAARRVARPDAAARIATLALELALPAAPAARRPGDVP